MKILLVATRNPDKLKEFKQILNLSGYQILGSNQIKSIPKNFTVVETGHTFKANAILKAVGYGNQSGLLTLADDSGLCIDCLHGRPGLNSARFAADNFNLAMRKILNRLKSLPDSERGAKFVCCLALYQPQTDSLHTFAGIIKGRIAPAIQGSCGFGYDPIFIPKNMNLTLGQLAQSQKNQLSHRFKALLKLKTFLSKSPIS